MQNQLMLAATVTHTNIHTTNTHIHTYTQDVLPPVVLTKEEESMKESLSSDLSKRLESDENVAHIGEE